MATTQVDFDVAAYTGGGWRAALSDDFYERLGLGSTDGVDAATVEQRYAPRNKWWLKREEQYKSGQQVPKSVEVGPHCARARRKLDQAKKTLSAPDLRGQYDRERAGSRLGSW